MATRCTPIPITTTTADSEPWWVRPDAIMASSTFRAQALALAMSNVTLAARADPTRIAIGFGPGISGTSGVVVGPITRPDQGGFGVGSTTSILWFNIFTYGPMVCAQWNAYASTGGTIWVYEWYRTP